MQYINFSAANRLQPDFSSPSFSIKYVLYFLYFAHFNESIHSALRHLMGVDLVNASLIMEDNAEDILGCHRVCLKRRATTVGDYSNVSATVNTAVKRCWADKPQYQRPRAFLYAKRCRDLKKNGYGHYDCRQKTIKHQQRFQLGSRIPVGDQRSQNNSRNRHRP